MSEPYHYTIPLADVLYSIHYFSLFISCHCVGHIFIIHFMPSSTIPLGPPPHSFIFFTSVGWLCSNVYKNGSKKHHDISLSHTQQIFFFLHLCLLYLTFHLTFHSATCLETSTPRIIDLSLFQLSIPFLMMYRIDYLKQTHRSEKSNEPANMP